MAPKSIVGLFSLLPVTAVLALNPSCAPGGNFNLNVWSLQLPTGSGGSVDTIKSEDLQGCNGYSGANFFTDKTNGELILTAPGNPDLTGCATTSGSDHCRTELREVDPQSGKNTNWPPTGTNTLTVKMKVVKSDDGTHGTAIGQVFASAASKPLAEMYYSTKGDIVVGVKPDANSNQVVTKLGNVPVGTYFTYVMSYSNNVLSISINGKKTTLSTFDWGSPNCYFKSGNYNQAKTAITTEVHIQSIAVVHS
ncbi:polysaccharide lyase family 7 protein [Trichoderma ceciliae]